MKPLMTAAVAAFALAFTLPAIAGSATGSGLPHVRASLSAKKGPTVMVFQSLMAIQVGLETAHDNRQTLDEEERFYKQAYYHACDVDNGTLADASFVNDESMEVTITFGPHTGCHGFVSFNQATVIDVEAQEQCTAAKNCVEINEVK